MEKNKKDYLVYTIGLQIIVCALLFAAVYGMKKTDTYIYKTIRDEYFNNINENIQLSDYIPSETLQATENATETANNENATTAVFKDATTTEAESMLTAVVNAQGGADYGVKDENDIPENVSVNNYTLSQTMFLPLKGSVSSPFGLRNHPISGSKRFHAGIDIAAPQGNSIYSAFDGKVIVADYDQWNGNYIKIEHDNNIMTVYCHCETLLVKKGDTVSMGQKIATVGSTGSSTGPHLHFELRINNVSYDPQNALDGAINEV